MSKLLTIAKPRPGDWQGLLIALADIERDINRALPSLAAWDDITGKPTTIGGYGITDFNSLGDARWSALAHTHTFASLTSKPTTIAGYGITDFNSLGDARWLALAANAASATILQTARTINGVSFNGSADITIAAAAGTLTGATLAAGVTDSSLTSVGNVNTGTLQVASGATVAKWLTGTAVFDPPSLAQLGVSSVDVTVTGAAVGDLAIADNPWSDATISISCSVFSVNTVRVLFQNNSGVTLNFSSKTVRVWVIKF